MVSVDDLIVSVSGIRGIIGQSLTVEAATAFAAALGTYAQGGRMVLSRDGRSSGTVLRHAVLAGLMSAGCEVQDIGIAPTPTFGLAVRRLQAKGGIQITASHNSAPWNGLKLFSFEGRVLTAGQGRQVVELFESGNFRRAAWNELGALQKCTEAETWHCDRVLELVDPKPIRARRIKVFLDANGGAGGPMGRRLLEALQCRLVAHACQADGVFEHEPEPTEANLLGICPLVRQNEAEIGLVLDPDADRLALIDETGRYIGEELTLALAVLSRLRKEAAASRGPVVVNMSTSRVIEDVARQFDVPFHRSAVGEANVAEKMHEVGALIGGEGNGGVIDPRVGYVRDPFIGMGLILSLLADTGKKLSELTAELPAYSIIKDKCTVDRDRLPSLLASLEKRWPEAVANRLDGLRLDWPDRWVHVRSSNTEPMVRIIAEAPKAAEAVRLCQEAGAVLGG